MGIQMPDLLRRDTGLFQGDFHGPVSAVAVFRAGRHMIGIRAGAVTDDFRQRRGAAGQGVVEGFHHQQSRPFPP